MKKAKTILSLILSLILAVSSLTAPAFASSDITTETAADPVYIPETSDTSVSPDPADAQVYPNVDTGSAEGASAGMSGNTDIVVPENTDVYVPEVIEPPIPENTAEAVPEIIPADDGKEKPRQEFETDHAKIRLFVPVTDINANIVYKLEKTKLIEGQDQLRDFKVEGQRILESYYFDPSPENIKENHIELILKDIEKAFIYITDRNGVIIKYVGEIYKAKNGSFEIIEDYSGKKKKAEFDFDRIIDEYGFEHFPGGFVIAETDPNYTKKDETVSGSGSTTENASGSGVTFTTDDAAVTNTYSAADDAAESGVYIFNIGDTSETVNDSTTENAVEFREIVQGFAGGVPAEPEGSDVTVTLAGNMPESAGAAAVENENSGSLYDFDLTLTAGDAADLSQESGPVEVSVSGEQILNAVTDGKTIAVYHGEESVEVKSVSQDTVAFDAEQSGEYIIAAEDKLTESLIDAGQNVTISGMLPENLSAEAAVTDAAVDGAIFAAGITLSNYDVSGIEPKEGWEEVTVSVTDESIREAAAEGKELYVYQQTGEDSWEEISDFTLTDDTVSFSGAPNSTYAIAEAVLIKTVDASDGNTYEINVTYGNTAGIPMEGTELLVSEILEGDPGYDEYVAASAAKVGADPENITLSKVFDIKIVNKDDHGIVYQPEGDVEVSIRLIGETLDDYTNVNVLHFVDDEKVDESTVVDVEGVVDGEAVQFTTDSFSVYVVIGHDENEDVVTPRVMFHFISMTGAGSEHNGDGGVWYADDPYVFINAGSENQTTQVLKDGESLELFTDPANQTSGEVSKYFYGWYVVTPHIVSGTTDEYGIGLSDNKLYYTWPLVPEQITFESPITIAESNVNVGDVVTWSLNGVSGSGNVDSDGNVHVLLAPLYEKYNFVNFMLSPYDPAVVSRDVMTRKLVARGSSDDVSVKISDIRAVSRDPMHLVFIGWEYFNESTWTTYYTVDYETGAEKTDEGKDGVYLSATLADTESIDLYPKFVEARWVDYFAGASGSGAAYVASGFRQAWGTQPGSNPYELTVDNEKTVFDHMTVSTRKGYSFDGWYAFAVTDENGEITNMTEPADVTIRYVDVNDRYTLKTVTVNTTAVKVADGNGNIVYTGSCYLNDNNDGTGTLNTGSGHALFGADAVGNLVLYDALDRLQLSAKWEADVSNITVVYWTENAQDRDYTAPADPKDDYTASRVLTLSTTDLTEKLRGTYVSGSTITRDELAAYLIDSVSILDAAYLDDIGAVPAGEEKFYERNNEYSDISKVIDGDGRTVFNVYYDRMTFKLVFHIGRDGFIKENGQQRTDAGWDGNWIEFMYDDTIALTYRSSTGNHNGRSYPHDNVPADPQFTMTYKPGGTSNQSEWEVYSSAYVTNSTNVMGNYVPSGGYVAGAETTNVYVITAKYGAYIGDRWPTPVNPNFEFSNDSTRSMYIWAAYYGSLYCGIAHSRTVGGNPMGNNPDINGVYNYMSAELCSNRDGSAIINENKVHHLVAYYGDTGKSGIIKNYHVYYEAISGTYDPDSVTVEAGSSYLSYAQTTWSVVEGHAGAMDGHSFYKKEDYQVISNLEPEYQLGSDIDGYDLVYSCYQTDGTNHDIYFFYRPKQYTLTFVYEQNGSTRTDAYPFYYTQQIIEHTVLDTQEEFIIPEPSKTGHAFKGWFTNEEGQGTPFDFDATPAPTMPSNNIVLYPRLDILEYTVKLDPNGGVIDHRANSSMATYFTGNYGTPIGEYTIEREYIKLTDKELSAGTNQYTGIKYYYINTQRLEIESEGAWGLPTDVRNAVYVAEDQIDAYYNWYAGIIDNADQNWWEGIQKLTKEDFLNTYADYPYRRVDGEHYTFMGWYQVFEDGSVDSMPYNFNDPVIGPLELRAQWRLDGGYYVKYNPYYFIDDNGDGVYTQVAGELEQWTDPENIARLLYADQSPTQILHAPTNTTQGWTFRGWRVVKANGTIAYEGANYVNWEPFGDTTFYQPGDYFTIDSDLVTETDDYGKIIHMQAIYEKDETSRRPEVTNLILDANDPFGGYVNTTDQSSLPVLNGPVHQAINTSTELYYGNPTQIEIGDMQSNIALHLYRYATGKTILGVTGKNLFTNENGYLLIGFDEGSDPDKAYDESTAPDGLRSGSPYIPSFASDSVIAVQRDENHTLYAIWEPMVYVTFVNTTGEPITVDLVGSGNATINVVNKVTGEFDRKQITTRIIIPANDGTNNGEVKIVLPRAVAGIDTITATAMNDHLRKKMSVGGVFGETNPYGTGSTDVKYGDYVTYAGTLVTDPEGIIVTYTEEPVQEIIYDVNGGTWTETSANYEERETGRLYALSEIYVGTSGSYTYEPDDPTPAGSDKVFLGWTTNPDIAAHTDFSSTAAVTWGSTTITPDDGGIVLDKIDDYLWNFDDNPEPLYGQTLYAVWSDTVTVVFDLTRTGKNLHTWGGPATSSTNGLNLYYRATGSSKEVTYTVRKGEKVPKPYDPSYTDWVFMEWVSIDSYTNAKTGRATISQWIFDFDQRVQHTQRLYTSWTDKANFQVYTFTVHNVVENPYNTDDEFTYTISAEDVLLRYGSSDVTPSPAFSPLSTQLKNGEEYTVRITITKEPSYGLHNYVSYDVFAEVIDRDGNTVGSGHLLTYNEENDARQYKYTIRVAQEPKTGYSTNVSTDETGTAILELDYDQFTFTSKTGNGNNYTPNLNPFTGGTDNGKDATVTFTNRRKADLTLTKTLAAIMGDAEHDFTFTLTSVADEISGTSYPYTKTLKDGSTVSGRFSTGGSFTLKHDEVIVISLPSGKAVVITESNGYYSTAWSTNDGTASIVNGDTAAAAITLTGDAAVTVTNTRQTRTITVKKYIEGTDTSGTFGFTATLMNGTEPVVGYTAHEGYTTSANGQISFDLEHNGTFDLTVPYGAKLVVTETPVLNFAASAAMTDGSDNPVADEDNEQNSFTLNSVETDGTITFTNSPVEVNRVLYDVNNGVWEETSQYYEHLSEDLYTITEENIAANGNVYKPADPTCSGKVFIGWTANAALAEETDFSGTSSRTFGIQTFTPGEGEILLDKVRSEGLWDFSQAPPYGQTLYAIWSEAVTVTFDYKYAANGSMLHTWNGPGPEPEAPYVFYESDTGEISYTLAKGERVPMPSDPSPHKEKSSWNFIRWLILNDTTDSYRNNQKSMSDANITTYAFDFSQRIIENKKLVTSWTTAKPQTFTFTVENRVTGGDPNEEFDYNIMVSDELVFGKISKGAQNTNHVPTVRWGSVATKLKNNEQYTVLVTVSYITDWGGANSVRIDVIDRNGITIKSGQVIYCAGGTYPNFVSDYRYTLTITQDQKNGYETTVAEENETPPNSIVSATSSQNRSFTFTSVEHRSSSDGRFANEVNNYSAGADNSLTVVFNNTGTIIYPAPTGLKFTYIPFILMGAAGVIFGLIVAIGRRRRRAGK